MIDNFGQIRQFALVYFVYYESFNAVQNVTYYYYRLWESNAVISKKKKIQCSLILCWGYPKRRFCWGCPQFNVGWLNFEVLTYDRSELARNF